MREMDGIPTAGVMVLPNAPNANWWKLMRHMATVAHLLPHSPHPHLEACTLGSWAPIRSTRSSLIAVFPRSAGMSGAPLALRSARAGSAALRHYRLLAPGEGEAGSAAEDEGSTCLYVLPRPRGTIIYTPDHDGDAKGVDAGAFWLLTRPYGELPDRHLVTAARLVVCRRSARGYPPLRSGRVLLRLDASLSYKKVRQSLQPWRIDALTAYVATPYTESIDEFDSAAGEAFFYADEMAARSAVARRPLSRVAHVTELPEDDESVVSLSTGLQELGSVWVNVPSPRPPAPSSEASVASWPHSSFSSAYTPSDVARAEFAVPDAGQPPQWLEEAQARLESSAAAERAGDIEPPSADPTPDTIPGALGAHGQTPPPPQVEKTGASGRISVSDWLRCEQAGEVSADPDPRPLGAGFCQVCGAAGTDGSQMCAVCEGACGGTCRLPGCARPTYPRDDDREVGGWHDYCGRSHARQHYADMHLREHQLCRGCGGTLDARGVCGAACEARPTCQLAGCDTHVHARAAAESGGWHDFCSASHAREHAQSARALARIPGSAHPAPAGRGRVTESDCFEEEQPWEPIAVVHARADERAGRAQRRAAAPAAPFASTLGASMVIPTNRANPFSRVRGAPTRHSDGEGTRQLIRSVGVSCLGCSRPIEQGTYGEVHGEGFIHTGGTCRRLATTMLPRRAGGSALFAPAGPSGAQGSAVMGDLQKQVRQEARFSVDRLLRVRQCIEGCCAVRQAECDAPPGTPQQPVIDCRGGCGRTLHAQCASTSSGHALTGRFTCPQCRLNDMKAEGQALPAVLDSITKTLLLDLTVGRTKTAQGYERFVALAQQYTSSMLSQGLTKVLMPQDSKESMRGFLMWMVLEADRAREFETIQRQAAGYLAATSRPPNLWPTPT